jgi:hypothetical protein
VIPDQDSGPLALPIPVGTSYVQLERPLHGAGLHSNSAQQVSNKAWGWGGSLGAVICRRAQQQHCPGVDSNWSGPGMVHGTLRGARERRRGFGSHGAVFCRRAQLQGCLVVISSCAGAGSLRRHLRL